MRCSRAQGLDICRVFSFTITTGVLISSLAACSARPGSGSVANSPDESATQATTPASHVSSGEAVSLRVIESGTSSALLVVSNNSPDQIHVKSLILFKDGTYTPDGPRSWSEVTHVTYQLEKRVRGPRRESYRVVDESLNLWWAPLDSEATRYFRVWLPRPGVYRVSVRYIDGEHNRDELNALPEAEIKRIERPIYSEPLTWKR